MLLAMTWLFGQALAQEGVETRRGPDVINVRVAPDLNAALVGQIAANEAFAVRGRSSGTGCEGEGWGQVEGDGYACLAGTTVTTEAPERLPRLFMFDGVPAFMPLIYAKRGLHAGRVWESVAAWAEGANPIDELDAGTTYRFVGALDTPAGRLLVRPNGSVVPAGDVRVFPITSFHGREVASGSTAGTTSAWVVSRGGARLRAAAGTNGNRVGGMKYLAAVTITATPVNGTEWFEVPNGGGVGIAAYVSGTTIRRWVPEPRPSEVANDAVWIDIDLTQQVLAVMRGDIAEYVTLISSGVEDHETPTGVFTITDKSATGDMTSLVGSDEPYHVEQVPWVMHFRPRYALHGAFWHTRFGHTFSHGCVNLSPADARYVYDRIAPFAPPGFRSINATERVPGTVVRIRGEP